MNHAIEIDEHIAYKNGHVSFHPLFVSSQAMQEVIPLLDGKQQRLQDLGIYVYFMYNGSSPYRNTDEKDRDRLFYHDKRAADPEWLKAVVKTEQVQELVLYYREVALTPGQRLHLRMMENMANYIESLSNAKADDDLGKLVKKGKELYTLQKEIAEMVREQGVRKIAKGYVPRRFETRPTMPAH